MTKLRWRLIVGHDLNGVPAAGRVRTAISGPAGYSDPFQDVNCSCELQFGRRIAGTPASCRRLSKQPSGKDSLPRGVAVAVAARKGHRGRVDSDAANQRIDVPAAPAALAPQPFDWLLQVMLSLVLALKRPAEALAGCRVIHRFHSLAVDDFDWHCAIVVNLPDCLDADWDHMNFYFCSRCGQRLWHFYIRS